LSDVYYYRSRSTPRLSKSLYVEKLVIGQQVRKWLVPQKKGGEKLTILYSMPSLRYDVIIVGAGIAGPAMAYALSGSSALRASIQGPSKKSKPLRILLIESKMATPDRIVGELLQPGGVLALKKLGLDDALEGIDAVKAVGYCVMRPKAQTTGSRNGSASRTQFEQVQIPYPDGHEGRSFHHGEFVSSLRRRAAAATGVTILEATVSTNLLQCPHTGRILGVRAKRTVDGKEREEAYLAKLTVFATGSSNFRRAVYLPESSRHHILPQSSSPNPPELQYRDLETKALGKFYGLILPHPPKSTYILPLYQHGTVILVPKAAGPILLYQISTDETRILIDVPAGSEHGGKNVISYIQNVIMPNLPTDELRDALAGLFKDAKANNPDGKLPLRFMPNPFFPAPPQGRNRTREGALLIGDAWNQRHPLTGGGMTVALWDVVTLAREIIHHEDELFGTENYTTNGKSSKLTTMTSHEEEWSAARWDVMEDIVDRWWWQRKGYASTINILSVALWDLFGGSCTYLSRFIH
jgi:squalene monooxygenase